MVAVALGLSAAVCWGLADYIGGLQSRRISGLVVVLVSQAVGAVALVVVMLAMGDVSIDADAAWWIALAGAVSAVGIALFYKALAIGTMGLVASITATGVIVPVLVGVADGERPSAVRAAGTVVAISGIVLATLDKDEDPERQRVHRLSIALAVLTALCFGIGWTALDQAAESGAVSAVLGMRLISVVLIGGAVVVAGSSFARVRTHRRGLVTLGLLDAAGVTLFALATTEGLLSVVAVLTSLYPVTTIALAHVLLKENLRPLQALGVVGALGGAGLVAAG